MIHKFLVNSRKPSAFEDRVILTRIQKLETRSPTSTYSYKCNLSKLIKFAWRFN